VSTDNYYRLFGAKHKCAFFLVAKQFKKNRGLLDPEDEDDTLLRNNVKYLLFDKE
jgi:hypothetical protein